MATGSTIVPLPPFCFHHHLHQPQFSCSRCNSNPNPAAFLDSSAIPASAASSLHMTEAIGMSYNTYLNKIPGKGDGFVDHRHHRRRPPPPPHHHHHHQQHHFNITMPPLAPRIGAGLANMGNTCFLNSVIQCLTYTPPLTHYLLDGLHKRTCKAVGFCAMCTLEHHVKEALKTPERIISPTSLVKNLTCISRTFRMFRQEDAHEYMRYLIEALKNCSPAELPIGESFIQSIFGGQLRSQVKCAECSHCSNTYDPFLDLSLEVVRADSLYKAFNHFTAVEILDGDNKYQCSKCNRKVRALKQFTMHTAPHVLTVHFKRFSSSGKIDKKIQFDETLDLKPFVSGGQDEDLAYSLFAVLVHSGRSTNSGHYYCFVRTIENTWHLMDDSRVSEVSERSVLEQKAYILFYVRNTKVMATQNTSPSHRTLNDNKAHAIQVDGFSGENGVQGTDIFHSEKGELMDKDSLSSAVVNEPHDIEVSNNLEVMGKCSTTVTDGSSELSYVSTIYKQQQHIDDGNECSGKEGSLSSGTDTATPKLRHTLVQSASCYVLYLLNICEKFCFPSCFWPEA